MSLSGVIKRFKFFLSSKKGVVSLTFIILLIFAWLLGKFVIQLLITPFVSLVVPQNNVPAVVASGNSSYIFGKPVKERLKERAKVIKMDSVKNTRLNIELIGIIAMPDKAVALIKVSNKTLVVFEGDKIINNVLLVEVFSEEVVIDNKGVQESLKLARKENKLLAKGDKDGKRNKYNSSVNNAVAASLSREESNSLDKIGRTLKKSPMSIAKFIKFKPINKNGSWAGVKIWSKSDKKLFRALGFKEGDILVNVNGRNINELASNPSLWQEFLKESQFELIVKRIGQEHSVSVDLSGN